MLKEELATDDTITQAFTRIFAYTHTCIFSMKLKKLHTVCLIVVSLLFGCLNPFAPQETGDISQTSGLLTNQENPDAVLINFKYAYTFKDSLVYSEIFDSTFIFRSWNFNVSPPVPIQWGRDVELKTTARMFHFFSTLDLQWNTTLELTFDSLQQHAEMRKTFTLTLDGGRSIPTLNGEVIFRFIRRGKKWYITFWEDQRI